MKSLLYKKWDQNLADEVLRRESFEDGFNSRDAEVAELKQFAAENTELKAQLSKYEQSNR
jgi:cell division protein FtsB